MHICMKRNELNSIVYKFTREKNITLNVTSHKTYYKKNDLKSN